MAFTVCGRKAFYDVELEYIEDEGMSEPLFTSSVV
jgi:hypothetical protein